MKKLTTALTLIVLSSFNVQAKEAQSEVIWKPMSSYTDVKATTSKEDAFHKNMKRSFEKQILNSVKEHLPEDHTLKVVFRDIDLEGIVDQGQNGPTDAGGMAPRRGLQNREESSSSFKTGVKMSRIKGDNHPAILLVDYFVYNNKKQIVAKGTETLSDANPRYRKRHSVPFHMERKVLKRWINKLGKTL